MYFSKRRKMADTFKFTSVNNLKLTSESGCCALLVTDS